MAEPSAGASDARRDWRVWRQDDAGNRFLVRAGLTEAEARALVATYEARGHKQMYWAERRETSQG